MRTGTSTLSLKSKRCFKLKINRRCFEIEFNQGRCSTKAAATSTATTTMHCLAAFHKASVAATCSHDHQRAPRKLSVPPTILPRRYTPAASVQLSHLTLSGCHLLSQGRPGVRLARHQRCRQALRRQRCAARRIGGCDKHCEYNDALPGRFLQGQKAATCAAVARSSTRNS